MRKCPTFISFAVDKIFSCMHPFPPLSAYLSQMKSKVASYLLTLADTHLHHCFLSWLSDCCCLAFHAKECLSRTSMDDVKAKDSACLFKYSSTGLDLLHSFFLPFHLASGSKCLLQDRLSSIILYIMHAL